MDHLEAILESFALRGIGTHGRASLLMFNALVFAALLAKARVKVRAQPLYEAGRQTLNLLIIQFGSSIVTHLTIIQRNDGEAFIFKYLRPHTVASR